MKLSEAIREGCKYAPQGFGSLGFRGYALCALGAAFEAISYENCNTAFPILECGVKLPCGHKAIRDLFMQIAHLNDHHRWTREAIAEWVETIERKLGLWDEPAHDVMAEAQQTVKELTHPVPVQS